jgi:multiple sugar transport system substrate-binding protein
MPCRNVAGGLGMHEIGRVERRTVLKAAGASAAALGLGALAGCGGNSGSGDGTVTIRYSWWGAEERAKKINRTVALFEKKYPKIKVKTDFQDYEAFWEKFQTQASGGNPPDVFQNAVTFLRKYDKRSLPLCRRNRPLPGKRISASARGARTATPS